MNEEGVHTPVPGDLASLYLGDQTHMGFDELDVVVRVADTGRGIAPEQLERVFEPFFSTRDAGSGLGLSIARQVAIAHGGAVHLESVLGEGTRVIVRLPRIGRGEEAPHPGQP